MSPRLLLHAPFDAFVLDEQDPRARQGVRETFLRGVHGREYGPSPPPNAGQGRVIMTGLGVAR